MKSEGITDKEKRRSTSTNTAHYVMELFHLHELHDIEMIRNEENYLRVGCKIGYLNYGHINI
jgi:hypothetical protein